VRIETVKSSNNLLIDGPIILIPDKYSDERGYFYESWNKKIFNKIIKREVSFVQDNHSQSRYGVLRGLHFQKGQSAQAKLVRVINGKVLDVIVDIRINSLTFKEWAIIEISKKNRKQLWIPEGFAHGFITVSKIAELNYKTNNFWDKDLERTIIWDDKDLKINWKLKELNLQKPFISEKDISGDTLHYLKKKRDLFL
tara:strand:+ start:69 stop:659 length:591 start_codon:yes stop_codon:yes gene_type:complete